MRRAIHQDQHKQDDLNRPEMRPYHVREHLLIARDDAACLPGEIDNSLQIVNDASDYKVDRRLPGNIISKRLIRIPIDRWQQVRDQYCLAEDQRRDRNRDGGKRFEMRALGHQHADKRDDVQRYEERSLAAGSRKILP